MVGPAGALEWPVDKARPRRPIRSAALRGRWTHVAAAIAIAVFAIVLWRTLAREELPRTGTTDRPLASHVTLSPGGLFCQPADVPGGTGAASFAASGAAVRFAIGPLSAQAGIRPGARFAFVRLPRVIRRTLLEADVCMTNTGRAPLVLYGSTTDALFHSGPFVTRIDWFRARDERRWSLGPTVAGRLPLMKSSVLGSWTMWLALVAVLAVSTLAIRWSLAGREA